MKVTLDLADLVARGELTADEAARLRRLAAHDTGTLASNIVLGFGTVAVTLGIWVLVPTAIAAIGLGLIVLALGLGLKFGAPAKWSILAQVCLTLGALGLAGGLIGQFQAVLWIELALAIGLGAAAVIASSGLLAAFAVLVLGAALGSGFDYMHATYALWTAHPALTIIIFSALTLGLYLVSQRLSPRHERLAIIAARTAILVINLAFLYGSLFGDDAFLWPDWVFIIAWAALLVGVGAWATAANRRWVVNAAAVFGALHFFTQWFERLGASPLTVLGGGLLLIAFGVALLAFNRRRSRPPGAASASAA